MQPSLKGIAEKARRQKDYRFRDLYRMLNADLLKDAWGKLNKQAATGIDGVDYKAYGANLNENITKLVENLKAKRYRAKLVRRHYIPKGNGGERPLGIPTIEDKLLQHAAMQILQAIYEEDFLSCCYGYRPKRSAHDAVNELQRRLYLEGMNYIVEADIKGYFDHMDHDWMLRMLEERVDDQSFLRLIRKWLKAGVLERDGKVIHPATGTPQGGIISPVLANIYMHYALILWFEKVVKTSSKGKAYLFVYADDFVASFQYEADAQSFYNALGPRLGKFGLELSAEKTKVVRFSRQEKDKNGSFEFLGFEFRWLRSKRGKDWVKRGTAKKKFSGSLQRLKEWCKKNRHMPKKNLMQALNAKLRGTYNYYGIPGNLDQIRKFHFYAMRILFKWLNRRSQTRSHNWKSFNAMLKRYSIVKPTICHPNVQLSLPLVYE